MEKLLLSKIRTDGGTQSRATLDEEWARELAGHLDDGADLPPVVVFYDGHDHWLADGFHRARGYVIAWRTEIPADVRQGSQDDAVWFSAGANLLDEAGNPRAKPAKRDDRRRAAEALVRRFPQKTVREIAQQAGVSPDTVSRIRREQPANGKDLSDSDKSTPPAAPARGAERKRDERAAARPPPDPVETEELEDEPDVDQDDADDPDDYAPESGPRASAQPPAIPREEPPPAITRSSTAKPITETLKDCVRGLTAAERAELFRDLGVVPAESLTNLQQQRDSDNEYYAWRQREADIKTKFGASRPQKKIDFVLAGGELALALLGLDYTVTPEKLAEVYRAAALAAHPDRGGDPAVMSALNQAHAIVRSFVEAA